MCMEINNNKKEKKLNKVQLNKTTIRRVFVYVIHISRKLSLNSECNC